MTEFVTLRNILEATPLGEAELLAGAGGLDREVRETNIIEVPDACDWMRGGEILFSAGYAFGGDGAQGAKLIRALAKRGITALVLKPGKYMPAVPQEMIETAEQLQFPLLQIPQDKPYSIYMEATFERLRDSRLYELRMITNLHSRLLNASIHGGMEGICKVLEERLNKPVALWDAKWRMRYGAERYPEWNAQMSGSDMRREASKETLSSFFIASTEGNEEGAQVYLGIQCGGQKLRESEQVVLRYAVSLLSLEA
ncbi:MAG: PucR family transcriptional regulator ligand-binding domain-containing protein, partial [Butyricicoccus sp.]